MVKPVGSAGIIVAQLGARMHYAVPRMLQSAGMLEHFYTDICAVKGWPRFMRYIPKSFQPQGLSRLIGRDPGEVPIEKITAFNFLGAGYALSQLREKTQDQIYMTYLEVGTKFCRAVIGKGLPERGATYTFNGAGLELMLEAKRRGLIAITEQTIAPLKIELDLLAETGRNYPEWRGQNIDSRLVKELIERETKEWQLADIILCGSQFVRDGIAQCGGPVDRCRVVPYGVDQRFLQIAREKKTQSQPLRVLTVGLGLRKGTPDILKAAEIVGSSCEFRCVGAIPRQALSRSLLPANVEMTGIVPRSEIFNHYRWADVFLLPSICEGSATVTYEALAAGLPVICTQNTGSIVEDGVDGFIVPVLAPDDIARCLMKFVNEPELFENISESAQKKSKTGSFHAYRKRFIDSIKEVCLEPRAD